MASLARMRHDVALAPFTTFELGGPARFFVDADGDDTLLEALAWGRTEGVPILVLGGGSNVVVADRGFDGLVIRVATRGVSVSGDEVTVAAGEPWDPFVARMVSEGRAGLECLSGIPGHVGGTPIQNVGAYGQEVSETIVSVRSIDIATGQELRRRGDECRFTYRHSLFKEEARGELVTSVTFALPTGGAPSVRYAELEKALAGGTPTLSLVRDTVVRLRRAKSMVLDEDDPNRRSAGSFFTNPIVTAAKADEIAARAVADGVIASPTEMPRFPSGSDVKLSAGFLIERAGMTKGTRRGNVGISSKHALALVHHGGGSSAELLSLAREVTDAVLTRFDVRLRPEPVLVGFGREAAL